jgi:hypothetical protein
MTSVIGHVYSTDFMPQFQDWSIDPAVLFDAPVNWFCFFIYTKKKSWTMSSFSG